MKDLRCEELCSEAEEGGEEAAVAEADTMITIQTSLLCVAEALQEIDSTMGRLCEAEVLLREIIMKMVRL